MNPRILVAGPVDKADSFEPYLEALRFVGGDPELAWPKPDVRGDREALKAFLRRYRGILLPGGVDIDPKLFGQGRHEKLGPTDEDLDDGQLAIARAALAEEWPTLAVCRGMQLMAVGVGAGLYQDLPSQLPSAVEHNIRTPKEKLAHDVEALDGSRLAKLCGSNKFMVNSRHHQAVREGPVPRQIGPFQITAWAPDGVIEGMEHPGHPFLAAVQWHPENLVSVHPPSHWLFEGFIAACRT